MKKKKVKKEDIYEKVCSRSLEIYSTNEIPAGVTHFEIDVDYSGCYYENDTPSYTAHYYKKKEG